MRSACLPAWLTACLPLWLTACYGDHRSIVLPLCLICSCAWSIAVPNLIGYFRTGDHGRP
jgi:hypothetical protein